MRNHVLIRGLLSLPGLNKDIAYAFLPISQSNTQHQLVSLNISSSISQTNLSLQSITSNLPFTSNDSAAFIPSITSNGDISVYAGSCSTPEDSVLWRFTPSNTSIAGNGTWAQQSTNIASDVTSTALTGANFLSSSFSFSALVEANASQSTIYIFGGMCPSSAANVSTWQSAANYSDQMLEYAPASSSSNTNFTLELPLSRGPPIAEAGFTITGLTPTYSNASGVMTQAQNFVLLGGQTQSAFINMSQVAIWSLPEESWSFVTVDGPGGSSNGNTELAVKSVSTAVDSRSGHSAVLTEDGSKVVVLGGWVGNVDQAADPQLVVLELGTGFGGGGDWKWSIPEEQPSGSGMYGHGAVMLPGNVMMVLGGYNITTSTSKRADSTAAMFFNATSLQWSSSYTNPAYIAAATSSASNSSSSSTSKAKKIGLGVGLGLGLAVIIIAILLFLWYSRRLRKRRESEQEKNLAHEPRSFSHSQGRMIQRPSEFPWVHGGWNSNNESPNEPVYESNSAVAGYENLHNGIHALGDGSSIPNPPRQISRKPVQPRSGKGMYQPMAFDFNGGGSHVRANSLGTAGPIHPIYEADEDDTAVREGHEEVGVALGDPSAPKLSQANRHSDPFRDPPSIVLPLLRRDSQNNHSPDAESPAQSREREVQEWVHDWAAADALLNAQARSHSNIGRVSPTRRAQLIAGSTVSSMSGEEDSGRTASNLSERSVAISAMSVSRSGSSQGRSSRSNSLRGFLHSVSPFSATILSTTVASTNMSPVFDGPGPHGPRSYRPPGSAGSGSGTSSFTTANTSFPALQAEGESLLPRPEELSDREHSPTRYSPDLLGSPSKSKTPARYRGQTGWLGSIRRAFAGEPEHGEHGSPVSPTFPSREASPVRVEHGSGVQPRRTVSAGATLWRRKQGKSDWEDSIDDIHVGSRSNTFTGDYPDPGTPGTAGGFHHDDEDEDWDIERAVENRVVQVMFTVPKEKLRVVNHDVNDDRSEVGSLRSKKGSAKSLKDAFMPPPLAEVDETPLPTHREESPKGSPRGKGKVLEMVEKMESRKGSPEH
ncbi:hypothetical protein LSUE1_G009938 [Lachnellula suecica]|uniref:Uncharacterized protein n=1 Tax=Lachnellula suecica TaxID=602035 RepID=A0A8T9BTQ1_9HELO|nr:hypothetical protein LSUE1_G009938 [Lachnellula suecica]